MNTSHFHIIKQDDAPQTLNLIVEIPKGDFNKYEYNHEYGILELDRTLYGPNYFPVNYCDVPLTWNKDDNDPLDAVVFATGPIAPGVLVQGKVIGIMEMVDSGEQDSKIICVASKDPRYNHLSHVDELREYEKKDLKTFFETYKYAQKGPDAVQVGEFLGPDEAYKVIEQALVDYKEKFAL